MAGYIVVTGSLIAGSPPITNTQEAGVDEGDVVKMYGNDILVILRRGRIFTVSIADGTMVPVDSIDAFPPGQDADGDWYDEMLVADGRVVVIGYSYAREASQINRFRISEDGYLRFDDSYELRSNDYYSSHDYASRLIGDELIVFSPLELPYYASNPFDALPAMRKWKPNDGDNDFERIVGARNVYAPQAVRDNEELELVLYTVIQCRLLSDPFNCDAKSAMGPWNRTAYVSANAFYIWTVSYGEDEAMTASGANSMLYRIPLDGSPPTAVVARGGPMDQFSFREDYDRNVLNVLVSSEAGGDAFWQAERSEGSLALITLPVDAFGDGSSEIDFGRYRPLPAYPERQYFAQNRFVGDYLLYDLDIDDNYETRTSNLVVVPTSGGEITQLALPHGVDRIDILGNDAIVVGGNSWDENADLSFTTIDLSSGPRPSIGERHVDTGAEQAESRSHAFFFHPDPGQQDNAAAGVSGVLGLPVTRPGRGPLKELY
jgi:hypothetical protein